MANPPPNENEEESRLRPRPLPYLQGRSQLRDLLRATGVQPYESRNVEPEHPISSFSFADRLSQFTDVDRDTSLSDGAHTHMRENPSILGNFPSSASQPQSPFSRPPSPFASAFLGAQLRDRAPGRSLQQELEAEFGAMADDLLAPWQNNPDYEEFGQFVDETVDENPAPVPGPPIATLPQRRLTAADEGDDGKATCLVCTENVAIGTTVTQLHCPHWFCTDCLEPWLALNNTCPACRARIEAHDRD